MRADWVNQMALRGEGRATELPSNACLSPSFNKDERGQKQKGGEL